MRKQDILLIFDFDDTLIKTSSKIKIRNKTTNEFLLLNSIQWAKDKTLFLDNSDYELNFEEFNQLNNKVEIKNPFYVLVNYIRAGYEVNILTARPSNLPIWQFFHEYINIYDYDLYSEDLKLIKFNSGMYINPAKQKREWIESYIVKNTHINKVIIYEDDKEIIKEVKKIKNIEINTPSF